MQPAEACQETCRGQCRQTAFGRCYFHFRCYWKFEKINVWSTTQIGLAATFSGLFLALSTFIIWKIVLCFKANSAIRRVDEEANPVLAYQNLLEQERVMDEELLERAGMVLRSGRGLSKLKLAPINLDRKGEADESDHTREADESDPEINFV